MYKCKLKVFLLSFAVFSFLATTSFGWDGPCWDSGACGGFGGDCTLWGGLGTCDLVDGYCTGTCSLCCAQGADNEYCAGLIGDCNESEVHCSEMMSRTCTFSGGFCGCAWPIPTGGYCWRQNC